MKKIRLLLVGLFAFLFLFVSDLHAQNIKMKIPSIAGLPADGEDILAFEVSDTQHIATGGGGLSVGKTVFEVAKIKKLSGASTNELWKRSLQGTHVPDVQFDFYNSSNAVFYRIVLKDVTVNHFSYLAPECSNCPRLTHQVWFDYDKIEVTDVATGNTVKWDRTGNIIY
jgi:type VI protein secretion system component Hcp